MSAPAPDKLLGVRRKIERAKKHILDLNSELAAFYATKPYKVRTKRDPQTKKLIYYVSSIEDIPTAIRLITADALQNLRSALDHLAFQLFLSGTGGSGGSGRHISFPIFDSAAKYKSDSPGKVKGIRPQATKAIDAIQPYQSGKGHQLWVLHELNNTDKHRLLLAVFSAPRSINLGAYGMRKLRKQVQEHWGSDAVVPILDVFYREANPKCPLEADDELFVDLPDAEEDKDLEFRFHVTLNEPQVPKGESLLETLEKTVQFVEGVVGPLGSLI